MNYQHMVAGTRRDGDGERLPVVNPATAAVIGGVPRATHEELLEAVAAATHAGSSWRTSSAEQRMDVLNTAAAHLLAQRDAFAAAIVQEEGKTLAEARQEGERAAAALRRATLRLAHGSYSMAAGISGQLAYSGRRPVGVVAAITPWNAPLLAPARLLGVALAAGNAVVLKPSPQTPRSAQMLAEVLIDAGLPVDVVQVLHGDDRTGSALAAHPDVATVACIGGAATVRALAVPVAERGGRFVSEQDATSTAIVLADADIDQAIAGVMEGAFSGSGQRMHAIRRLIVVHPIADALLERLVERAKAMRLGAGDAAETTMGPLVSAAQRDLVLAAVAEARAEGAEVLSGGQASGAGFFVPPTLLDRVRADGRLAQAGVFGPVLAVLRADSAEEAIELANSFPDTHLTELYTRDAGRMFRAIDTLDAPTVVINRQGLADDEPDSAADERLFSACTHVRRVVIDYDRPM